MNIYQSFNNYQGGANSAPNQKYIDPDKIYPKRLGTYQGGNALVLEYYNLAIDKFKKHVIPLDHTKSAKQNLQLIYKNPKHSLLLRKVEPKYIQSAIKGQNSNYQQNSSIQHSSYNKHNSSQPESSFQTNSFSKKQYSQNSSSFPQQSQNCNPTYSNVSNQNSVSNIIIPKASLQASQEIKHKVEEVQQYYDQEFQDFQISQSMGHKNNLKNKPQTKNLSINSNSNNQSITMPLQSKYENKVQKEKEQSEEKKVKKSKKSKDGKKSKKKKQEKQQQQDQFDFDFLDGVGKKDKKKSTEKKEKTKEKTKEKSKEKKKQEKPKKQQKPAKVVEQSIEEDFDFL